MWFLSSLPGVADGLVLLALYELPRPALAPPSAAVERERLRELTRRWVTIPGSDASFSVYSHLDRFRRSRSLRQFKSKFAPTWEERHLAVPTAAARCVDGIASSASAGAGATDDSARWGWARGGCGQPPPAPWNRLNGSSAPAVKATLVGRWPTFRICSTILNKHESKAQISEKLYNTKEAARFLRVSEASIRRWSDGGKLQARRIGGRRERRFTHADLLRFLGTAEVPAHSQAIPRTVNVGGSPLPLHANLATLYDSDPGRLRLTVPFIADGLRAGQPCYLAASGDVLDAYVEALGKEPGVDLDAAIGEGRFVTIAGPGTTVEGAVSFWEQAFWRALADGPSVLRVVGEMKCELHAFSSEAEMMRYEVAFNTLARRFPTVTLCQYDVREFGGEVVFQAIKAHPDLYSVHLGSFLS